jgi:hypothetical protein
MVALCMPFDSAGVLTSLRRAAASLKPSRFPTEFTRLARRTSVLVAGAQLLKEGTGEPDL